jgi:hypothetical protein
MLDRLEAVLRTGADQFAETVWAPSAELIRARGDRRRMRSAAGSAVAAAIVVTVAVAATQALTGSGHAGFTAISLSSLRLNAPSTYLAGVPNPVTFTIPGQHHPATVTVKLDLGKPSYAVDGKGPIVFRRDPVTNRWLVVALTSTSGGWTGDYTVLAPAVGLAQHLAIVPALAGVEPSRAAGRLKVQVLLGRKVIVSQRGPATSLAEILGSFTDANAAPLSVPRGESRDLTVTVYNPGSVGYRFSFSIFAMLCPGSTCPGRPGGINVQWLRAGRWRDLSQAAWLIPGNGQMLQTRLLAPLATMTFRFRVLATARAPSLTGQLELDVDLDRASVPIPSRLYPHYTFTADSTFIDIG